MPQDNVEVARRAIAAYNRRDFEAIRALNHPDVQVDWSASRGLEAGVYQGLEQVIRFFQSFLDMFEEVEIKPERFIESGASIVVPNSAQLRGRDGIETVARSALVFEVRDGRVARMCLYQETHEALEALERLRPSLPQSAPPRYGRSGALTLALGPNLFHRSRVRHVEAETGGR